MLWGEVPKQNYTHSDICPLVFLIRYSGTQVLTGIGSRSGGITKKRGEKNGTKSNYAGNA